MTGACVQEHSCTHGMSPFEERAGVAAWHTFKVTRTGRSSWSLLTLIRQKGGTAIVNTNANRTMTACHLMTRLYKSIHLVST